jgi:hypothetical protein
MCIMRLRLIIISTTTRWVTLFAALVLFGTSSLQGTVIVVVKTSDGYWIGADGVRSFSSGGPPQLVCKIHQSHGWIVLKSGATQSWDRFGTDYSVDAEVKKIVEVSSSSQQLETQLADLFTKEENEFIRWYIATQEPSTLHESNPLTHIFTNPIPPEYVIEQSRVLTLIGFEHDQPVNLSLITAPVSKRDTGVFRFPYRFDVDVDGWRPTKLESGPITFLSYPTLIPPKPIHPDEWIKSHPRDAIEEVLKAAHDSDPKRAGPPYAIIHMTTNPKPLPKEDSFDGSK